MLQLDLSYTKRTFVPEKNLLIAILHRAILDYIGNQPLQASEAEEWLFSEAPENCQFSFHWVCLHLGLAPKDILKWLKFKRSWRIFSLSSNDVCGNNLSGYG